MNICFDRSLRVNIFHCKDLVRINFESPAILILKNIYFMATNSFFYKMAMKFGPSSQKKKKNSGLNVTQATHCYYLDIEIESNNKSR